MTEPQTNENEETLELSEAAPETDALVQAQAEIADLKDKYLRAVAEMQNIQKRAQRDIEDAGKYGVISAAKPFLGVADNLARALDAAPPEIPASWLDGVRATQRELQNALERMGVTPVAAEAGQILNPHEHEVMFEVPGDQPSGTIVQVLEKGYKIHDRLLRPARVSVAKNAAASDEKAMDVEA